MCLGRSSVRLLDVCWIFIAFTLGFQYVRDFSVEYIDFHWVSEGARKSITLLLYFAMFFDIRGYTLVFTSFNECLTVHRMF